MCLNGNNADHASDYVNSQLAALWRIAAQCAEHYREEGDDLFALPGYDTVLKEFRYRTGTKKNPVFEFEVAFGTPVIEWVCNHELLLHLHVESATLKGLAKLDGRHLQITEEAITVRIPFGKFSLRGESALIGNNGQHDVNTFVLDISKARFVDSEHSIHVTEDWAPHFIAYLDLFKRAGHHVLFSLPDFDDDRKDRKVDFSSVTKHVYPHFTSIFGVELESINKFLQEAWLAAAWRAEKGIDVTDIGAFALAEFSTKWGLSNTENGRHFSIKFGVPTFQVLCESEAVLTLHLDTITFHRSREWEREITFHDWRIPIIVRIVHVVHEGGSIVTIKIDHTQEGIFLQEFAELVDFYYDDDEHAGRLDRLLEFLLLEYWQLLESTKFHLFRHDKRTLTIDGPWFPTGDGVGSVHEIIQSTEMYGFEHVIALSRHSVDEVFLTYFKKYEWLQRFSSDEFSANFGPLRVRLLSNRLAVVWVHIKDGKIRTRTGAFHEIKDWKLAFSVPIVKPDISRESSDYKHAPVWGQVQEYNKLRQIVLNFEGAKFLFDQSIFKDSGFEISRLAIDKVQASVRFTQTQYFSLITRSNTDVIYTVVTTSHPDKDRYAFSDVDFQVYSKFPVDLSNFDKLHVTEEPIIIILGMVTPGAVITKNTIKYSSSWLLRTVNRLSYGTVALASSVFLHGRLLPLLAEVNAFTTLVPDKIDFHNGNWVINLITWGKHLIKQKDTPTWVDATEANGSSFEYVWNNLDRFDYQHKGRFNGSGDVRHHHLLINTSNTLSIPTTFRQGKLDIILRGESSVEMGWNTDTQKVHSKALAKWAILISAVTTVEGLTIKLIEQSTPHFDVQNEGIELDDPLHLLKHSFPETIHPVDQIAHLKSFEKVWHAIYPGIGAYNLANPFFNKHGDLLLDLVPQGILPGDEDLGDLPKSPTKAPRFSRAFSGRQRGDTSPRSPIGGPKSPLSPILKGFATNGDKNGLHLEIKDKPENGSNGYNIPPGVTKDIKQSFPVFMVPNKDGDNTVTKGIPTPITALDPKSADTDGEHQQPEDIAVGE